MKNVYHTQMSDMDVSRETIPKLEKFIETFVKWQPHINLVSMPRELEPKQMVEMLWQRHLLDSLQIVSELNFDNSIIDIGSGGGFPGLMIAAAGAKEIYLVESDKRKCEFLREAARSMEVEVRIVNQRIETFNADEAIKNITITSRACASILKLLSLTEQFHQHANYVLLKGEKTREEIEEAGVKWSFSYSVKPSQTHSSGNIVLINKVRPYETTT